MSNLQSVEAYISAPTYQGLTDMIQIYLNRYDEATTDTIPFFINATEKTLLRTIRMPTMEKIVKFTLEGDGNVAEGYMDLPFDYLEMRYVWIQGENPGTLQRISFDQILRGSASLSGGNYNPNGGGGISANDTLYASDGDYNGGYWAINGTRMYVKGVEAAEPIYLTYYKDIPELNSTTQTNPLLELLPDAFLYLAIAEGFRFLMEPEKGSYWEGLANNRIAGVYQQVQNAEFSGGPLTISPI